VAVLEESVADNKEKVAGVVDPVMVSCIVVVGHEYVVILGLAGTVLQVLIEVDEEKEG